VAAALVGETFVRPAQWDGIAVGVRSLRHAYRKDRDSHTLGIVLLVIGLVLLGTAAPAKLLPAACRRPCATAAHQLCPCAVRYGTACWRICDVSLAP